MKEIQVVIQKRRILSGQFAGCDAIKEIECRDDKDVRQANTKHSTPDYTVTCTHIVKRSVPEDYKIHFSID